jgi:hypothetical protein
VIVLNPLGWQAKVTEIVLAVGFHEKAALIAQNGGHNDHYISTEM